MVVRNRQPVLIIITVEGDRMEFLEVLKGLPLSDFGGKQVKKLTWIRGAEKNVL
jgi:hypothetical protein